MVEKVIATPATLELIEFLKKKYGPALMFHQSGGCCDNSAANCYLPTDLTLDPAGRYLYEVNVGSASVKGWRLTGATTSAGLAAVNATAAADLPADASPFGVVVVDK